MMFWLILQWTITLGFSRFAYPLCPQGPIYTKEWFDALCAAIESGEWTAYIEDVE